MSVYSFKITKGRYQLSLTTTDKELVVDQFARWVRQASEYVQKHKVQQCKEIVKSQINAEQEITQKKIDEQLKRMPKTEPVEELPKEDTNKNLDIFYAPHSSNNEEFKTTVTQTEPQVEMSGGFDNILEKSIQAPQTYYFTQYEQKPRFTLKQLTAKLMQNIAVIIDHSVLQEAINRDYIECLPDLTGLVGASEYRLTAYGEKVLLDA